MFIPMVIFKKIKLNITFNLRREKKFGKWISCTNIYSVSKNEIITYG
jgi:hypothetical protein